MTYSIFTSVKSQECRRCRPVKRSLHLQRLEAWRCCWPWWWSPTLNRLGTWSFCNTRGSQSLSAELLPYRSANMFKSCEIEFPSQWCYPFRSVILFGWGTARHLDAARCLLVVLLTHILVLHSLSLAVVRHSSPTFFLHRLSLPSLRLTRLLKTMKRMTTLPLSLMLPARRASLAALTLIAPSTGYLTK